MGYVGKNDVLNHAAVDALECKTSAALESAIIDNDVLEATI